MEGGAQPWWPGRRAEWWYVTGIAVLALGLRVAVVIATRHSYHPVNDPLDFVRIARSIRSGHGFGPTVVPLAHGASAFRTPLYPAFLAGVFLLTGYSITAARLATALVSAVFVLAAGALGAEMGGRRVGAVTLAISAVYPPFILAGYGINYEPLFLVLTTLPLIAVFEWRRRPGRGGLLVLAGASAGLAVLCRESAALILVPGCILVLSRDWSPPSGVRRRAALLSALIVPAVVVVAPWTVRNAIELHAFIPVSDSPSEALAGSYNPVTAHDYAMIGAWRPPFYAPEDLASVRALGPAPTEPQVMAAFQHDGLHYAATHPGYMAKLALWNTVRMFGLRGFRDPVFLAPYIPWDIRLTKLSVLAFWVLAPLALAGLCTRRCRAVPPALWAYPGLTFLVLVLTVADIQYRVALEPFAVVAASFAAVAALERLAEGRSRRASVLAEDRVEVVAQDQA